MTPVEYMHKKNALVKDYTGLILIPEDQIIEVEPRQLYEDDDEICPYCAVFSVYACENCPMKEAGNECVIDSGNTYDRVAEYILHQSSPSIESIYGIPGMRELVAEYNEQFSPSF